MVRNHFMCIPRFSWKWFGPSKQSSARHLLTQTRNGSIYKSNDGKVYKIVDDPEAFLNEKNILEKLGRGSKTIISLLGSIPKENTLILPLAERDLFSWLFQYKDQRPFALTKPDNVPLLWNFLRDFSKGLSFLFQNQIEHYDIKAENLLIFQGNRLKICDFGHSIHQGKGYQKFMGTKCYMAPEVLFASPSYEYVPHSMDVYSSAMMLLFIFYPECLAKCMDQFIPRTSQKLDQQNQFFFTCINQYPRTTDPFTTFLSQSLRPNPSFRMMMTDFLEQLTAYLRDPETTMIVSPPLWDFFL